MITDDRRAFKRAKKKVKVRYIVPGADKCRQGTCLTRNISRGGIYFISFRKFDIGQQIDCYLEFPDMDERQKYPGRVVRCDPDQDNMVRTFGVAVEFSALTADQDRKLREMAAG